MLTWGILGRSSKWARNEKETNSGGRGTLLALLLGLVKRKSEMKKCFTAGQGRSRLLVTWRIRARQSIMSYRLIISYLW